MIISMTGFGNASLENDKLVVVAEIKSLNSKFLDINLRLPRSFPAEKEIELRNLLKDKLVRGKVNATLEFQYKSEDTPHVHINHEILKAHYTELQSVATTLGATQQDLLRLSMQMPDVLIQDISQTDTHEEDWLTIRDVFVQAIEKCQNFRKSEGEALEKEFHDYIAHIGRTLTSVEEQDPQRIEVVKTRIQGHLKEIEGNDLFDKNRFEQEMIYFIEKLDITEEKVRLKNHLDYFVKTLNLQETSGKKLNFISQEIGREINTIGSKANDASIQQLVVGMKEQLEKIKEQTLNVL